MGLGPDGEPLSEIGSTHDPAERERVIGQVLAEIGSTEHPSGDKIQTLAADQRIANAAAVRAESDNALRKTYADNILRILIAELLVSNGVFIAYAWAGRKWNVPTAAINAWLGATVVQVVGIVLVVTRHLFPNRDESK